jgi:hypothetical protein
MGRRMNEGAENLVDHVLPEVPIRQWVLTLPHPLRFLLAFDGRLLAAVLRIFIDTVAACYRARQQRRGLGGGVCGAVAVIQRGSSDLRLNPHFHVLFLDGVYRPDGPGNAPLFHPAAAPTQADVEAVVHRARLRIVRYLERRGAIAVVTAPGHGELTVASDEGIAESDPLLARLLAAAAAGAPPAGPALKRAPVRLSVAPGATAQPKGRLCAQDCAFNLHAASRVLANDRKGRLRLCRYVLRPPLAHDHLHLLPDGSVTVQLKRPWSDGTSSIALPPIALICRLAALVPPPRRHVTRYFGVLSSHSKLRAQIVPPLPDSAPAAAAPRASPKSPGRRCQYIPWAELLRRTFAIDVVCQHCGGSLRLIALIKTEATIKKILTAIGLPAQAPRIHPARPPPSSLY